jgi:tetratricopeptide (TPR) repeat protein
MKGETVSPQELLRCGQELYNQGDYLNSAGVFCAAADGFLVRGDEIQAAEMKNNASVAFLQGKNPQEALNSVGNTADVFAQVGDLRRQGMAFGNLGSAFEALGRKAEAADAYRDSAKLLKEAGEDQLCANVLQSLSTLQLKSGQQLEALVTMREGLDNIKHPSLKQRVLKKLLRVPNQFFM